MCRDYFSRKKKGSYTLPKKEEFGYIPCAYTPLALEGCDSAREQCDILVASHPAWLPALQNTLPLERKSRDTLFSLSCQVMHMQMNTMYIITNRTCWSAGATRHPCRKSFCVAPAVQKTLPLERDFRVALFFLSR